ncbi:2-dehydro-3-deoxy-phosphogluconate aldolase [Abyssisolibacter fermentans]|uniref:2-dehydro-3-deoxy-phosphogluconate aldolase n=1 Tax=Abyssisolibacter fermentans TaxID=1766203 RepID=UPI00082AB259|nr:KDGP aldolase [Abyssisolibacter fermentans]
MDFERFNFYKGKVAVNYLAKDADNAKEVFDAMDGNTVIGLLSKNFDTVEEAVEEGKKYLEKIPVISIGLGAGDPKQWKVVAEIASKLDPGHANQVYTAAGYTAGVLNASGCNNTFVNALISPTGVVGKVKISTGPESSNMEDAVVDVKTAITMLKEIGVKSVKFFHMKGIKHIDELKAVAEACAELDMPVIEPTGGIDASNVYKIVKVCLDAGCNKIIPHVYTSVIDKETGLTSVDMVKEVYNEIKKLF